MNTLFCHNGSRNTSGLNRGTSGLRVLASRFPLQSFPRHWVSSQLAMRKQRTVQFNYVYWCLDLCDKAGAQIVNTEPFPLKSSVRKSEGDTRGSRQGNTKSQIWEVFKSEQDRVDGATTK